MNKRHYLPKTKAAMLACGFLSASCFTYAQDADEEVFELSPFNIDASEDEGYYASQTMAGGRLNQSLKNTGASIQVITKDFMDDLGATGVEELLQYTTSSEVAGILGNFTGAGDSVDGTVSTGGARRDPDGAARIRGLAAPDRTRNFFVTEIPFDSYNTERIDINRGANSFLFGLGTPAGLINNGLAQARFKDSNEISARIGSGGKDPSYRATFKLNRVVVEDKLAILVAGLYDRTQYRQRPTFRNDDRFYTAFTYRPFGNTNTIFSGHVENGKQLGNAPDVLLPQHNLDTFLDGGQGIDYGDGNGPITNGDLIARRSLNAYQNLRYFNNQEGPNNNNHVKQAIKKGLPEGASTDIYRNRPYSGSLSNFNWGAGALGFVFDGSNGRDVSYAYTPQYRGNDYNRKDTFWDPQNKGKGAPQLLFHGNRGEIGITGWQDQGFTDLETFDFSRNNLGWDNDYFDRDFTNFNFSLKQTFWENNGGFEIAYDNQDLKKGSYTAFNGGNSRVIFDIQEYLLYPTQEYLDSGEPGDRDGDLADVKPNPNYGRPFVLTKSGRRSEDLQDETMRFTGFVKYNFMEKMNNDNLARLLGDHTFTFLADNSTSDEIFVNWTKNSFGDEGGVYDPGHHIGAANARQSANNVRNTPIMAYIGPQQLDAFSDPNFAISDFQLTPADYALSLPSGFTNQRLVWHLGPDANASNYETRNVNYGVSPINGNEDWREVTHRVLEVPTKNYRLQRTEISSMAVNSQSKMLDNHLVLNMGYREDTIDNWLNTEANFYGGVDKDDEGPYVYTGEVTDYNGYPVMDIGKDQVANLDAHNSWALQDGKFSSVKSNVFGYGGVVYWPKNIIPLPEFVDDITFHYNQSENFVPATDRVDQYRNKIESPSGTSKDWGVSMYMFQNKVVARLNWYDAFLQNERSPVSGLFNQINSSIFAHFSNTNLGVTRLDADGDHSGLDHPGHMIDGELITTGDHMVDDSVLIEEFLYDPETGMAPIDEDSDTSGYTRDQLVEEFYPYLEQVYAARDSIAPGLTDELKKAYNYRLASDGSVDTQWAGSITDTNDISAQGFEAEVIINPTKSWRIAFNAAQQETVLTNIAPRLTDLFINTWIPHLTTQIDPDGPSFGELDWNLPVEPKAGNNTTQQVNSRMIDYFVAKTQEGKTTGEQREWRFNFITNYQFREGPLTGFSVGGAMRWQDEFNSGYPLFTNENNFIIPDVANAYVSPSETSVDLTFGYRKKIFDNVDWRLQVNVRNVQNWDNSDLLTNKYQPDGSIARVRFGPPRQILLTNTFKF